MVETEGFRPQLFILHYSFFIIHYWVYRNDKPKFEVHIIEFNSFGKLPISYVNTL